jgi:hypothetical protein
MIVSVASAVTFAYMAVAQTPPNPPLRIAISRMPRNTEETIRPRRLAGQLERLLEKNANNTEIVRFTAPGAGEVRVVRGREQLPRKPVDHPAEIAVSSGQRIEAVQIVRAGTPLVRNWIPMRTAARAAVQVVRFADRSQAPVTVLRGAPVDVDRVLTTSTPGFDLFGVAPEADLDRIAFAVDGAESSHGADPGMWRPQIDGPQGPMQVSAAAAVDSGGGDRFDLLENRELGRAYLALLFRRYGNWQDAVTAYNWGPGNLDIWIAQGRPMAGLPLGVERYRERVLRDGGVQQQPNSLLSRTSWQRLQRP